MGKYDLSRSNVMGFTETPTVTETKLKRIAALSAGNREMIFTQLMHHFNEESLLTCYQELDGKKAKGNDGVDKASYGKELTANLKNLVERLKRMAYIPGSVRLVQIPKEGKPGATRPLGISNFEDKVVQKMMQKVLESIYEPLFYENSYGFRPGRGCHDAIKALQNHLNDHETEAVIDVDLSNFFGSIDRKLLIEIIGKKIGDPRLIRYLIRMFKAGILSEGELTYDDEGVVQGSSCSPILANIFAHEVIDEWMEEIVKPLCVGTVKMIRYADDIVICCGTHHDAERIKAVLGKRLAKFNLRMNEEKTKLVKFSKRKQAQGEKQETFDFLGFTLYLGNSRRGKIVPKVKTRGKTLRAKLKKVNIWAKEIRNKFTMNNIMKKAAVKLSGHIRYYGVSHNSASVGTFVMQVQRILFKWLNRRSQRKSFTWEQFKAYLDRIKFPEAKIHHRLF
jgi:group II intron reverse transcriptase/maturase